ncbi:MAG: hypothetical protein ACJAZ2_001801 [Glaciecola sp.]|jgi:uncharacterized protein YecA (UPF0149 family)
MEIKKIQETQTEQSSCCSSSACCQGSEKTYGSKKIGRNEPCPCGSERKFKKCCGKQ